MADSTTSRLTVAALRLIGAWCLAMNAGVIVRYKGEELGIEAENLTIKDGMVKWTGEWVKLKDFTIKKLTLKTLEADLAELRTEALINLSAERLVARSQFDLDVIVPYRV